MIGPASARGIVPDPERARHQPAAPAFAQNKVVDRHALAEAVAAADRAVVDAGD